VSVLLLDAGNTRVKWRLRNTSGVIFRGGCAHTGLNVQDWAELVSRADRVLVASVTDNSGLRALIEPLAGDRLYWVNQPLTEIPGFYHCYPHPERLGVDRWLAMLGARQHCDDALLVIDAGTALTVDFLTVDNHHDGGFIVPGLELTRQALWQNTQRVLPYSDEHDQGNLAPGRETLQCVSAGVRRQQLAFVKSILDDYPGHRPFITGGDGDWLATALAIRYWPELVFDGLETLCAGYFSR
jgi:type III pantothenate kinase